MRSQIQQESTNGGKTTNEGNFTDEEKKAFEEKNPGEEQMTRLIFTNEEKTTN